ncbi:acyl-CoA thioesterase [Gordonia sp. TBRC 11910]|uniref:Acyl-CoA thioesterase n=1 Tax=Gordonia asplenii TaxID=2725283 RepID=A0A848L1R5_9ACTN|nr:thioesterase family protein [Gordonia asplenii]NMO04814.1 acyl-CoA thioesterase [Gordonia asplenii]
MPVVYSHRVRYHETDQQRFLFNAHYLMIADIALTEYYRMIGCPYPDVVDRGFDPSVVKAEISFQRPTYFDDILDVDVTCTRVGTSSFDFRFTMTRGDATVAVIEMVYVNVDIAAEKSTPIPADVAAALRGA